MGKESVIIGSIGILIGAAIYIKTGAISSALVPTILGILLIIFSKEEDKIEKRRDK